MHHERLKHIKETLMCAVEMQLCDLSEVDTKELGEAIDMIKDLEEAIYYCTVTEAMTKPGHEMEFEMKNSDHRQEDYGDSRMYYDNGGSRMYADSGRKHNGDGTFYPNSGQSHGSMMGNGRNSNSSGMDLGDGLSSHDGTTWRDEREGRSYNSRKMYMEAKDMKRDKATQLRELEKYMQELSQDITEMIADASPEEKQYLEKKITALASKIGQMK